MSKSILLFVIALLLTLLVISAKSFAQDTPQATLTPIQDKEVTISAPEAASGDDVQTYPEKISVIQPPQSLDLNFSLRKLPGAVVTQYGGPGSSSTIISPIATGSGGTMVSIDGVPVISPFGRGTDLTYLPPAFFKRSDWYSPFYPWAEGRIAPGGRLDMISRTPETEGTKLLAQGFYGTAGSGQAAVLVSKKDQRKSWTVGVTGFKTDGNFNYTSPVDGTQQTRLNNDNKYLGLLIKKDYEFSSKTKMDFTGLSQVGHRSEPLPIAGSGSTGNASNRDVFFGQAALKLTSQDLFIDNSVQTWTLSHSVDRSYYNNLTVYSLPFFTPRYPLTGGENSQGDFFSWQIKGKKSRDSFMAQADALYELVDAYYPVYTDRQIFGLTLAYDAFKLSDHDFIIPRTRVEGISAQRQQDSQVQADASIGYVHEIDATKQIFASANLMHKLPSMVALYGYIEGGLPVSGNATLPVERASIYSLGFNTTEKSHSFWISGWYSRHMGMALRTTSNQGLGQFILVNEAQTYGLSGQVACQFDKKWSVSASGSLEKTRNNDLGTELTYKPTYIVSGSLSYEVAEKSSVTLEDIYEGTRYFSSSNVSAFPNGSTEPMNWLNLRSDVAFGPGSVYLKVNNILNASGFDIPGYPYPGISYWVGYSYMGDI